MRAITAPMPRRNSASDPQRSAWERLPSVESAATTIPTSLARNKANVSAANSHRSSRTSRSNLRNLGAVAAHQSRLGALMLAGHRTASCDSSGIGNTTSTGSRTLNARAPALLDQPSASPRAPKCVGTRSGRTATCHARMPSHAAVNTAMSTRIHGAAGSRGSPRASAAMSLVVVTCRSLSGAAPARLLHDPDLRGDLAGPPARGVDVLGGRHGHADAAELAGGRLAEQAHVRLGHRECRGEALEADALAVAAAVDDRGGARARHGGDHRQPEDGARVHLELAEHLAAHGHQPGVVRPGADLGEVHVHALDKELDTEHPDTAQGARDPRRHGTGR